MKLITPTAAAALLLAALGCGKTPPPDEQSAADGQPPTALPSSPLPSAAAPSPFSLADRDWTLATLGGAPAPRGTGGRPVTIRFDGASSRAAGFAGCNRFSARYTTAGDSLGFGPIISTKMACIGGDDLERRFLSVLEAVTRYNVAASTLTLSGGAGPLAQFRAAAAEGAP